MTGLWLFFFLCWVPPLSLVVWFYLKLGKAR